MELQNKGRADKMDLRTSEQKATDEGTCRCGCGVAVKGTYRPGHDAKHVASYLRAFAFTKDDQDSREAIRRCAYQAFTTQALYMKFQRGVDKILASEI